MAWYYIVLIGVGVLLTAYLVFVIRQTLRGHLVSWDNTFRGFLQAVHYVFDYYLIKWNIRHPYKTEKRRKREDKAKARLYKVWEMAEENCHFIFAVLFVATLIITLCTGIKWMYIPAGACLLATILTAPIFKHKDFWYKVNPFYRKRVDKRRGEMKRKEEKWLAEYNNLKAEEKRQDEANHYHQYAVLRMYKKLPFTLDGQFLAWRQLGLTEEEYKLLHQTDHLDRNKRIAIYYEPSYNASVNQYIEQHYNEICDKLGSDISFVYIPKILADIQSFVNYSHPDAEQFETHPYSAEDFYKVIRENIVKIPTENPMLLISDYYNSAGYPPDMLDDSMFSCYFLDLEYINDEQFSYCLNKNLSVFFRNHAVFYSLAKVKPELTADYDKIDEIAKEIRERIEHLYSMGVSDYIIKQIVALPEPKLSPMLITEDFRIVLTAYNNMEIEMPTLSKTLYFFYLRHPEGVMFKDLREYKLELSEIYRTISPREDMDKMETSIEDLVDSTKNSVNEKRSRIKSAFVGKFTDEIAVNYYIVGRGSESKKINFDRELITDKSGILSMQTSTAR